MGAAVGLLILGLVLVAILAALLRRPAPPRPPDKPWDGFWYPTGRRRRERDRR